MNKLGIIIKREYLTRVKKRSFIILTILGPVLFAALIVTPALLMKNSYKLENKKNIAVLDETGLFHGKIENTNVNTFIYVNENEDFNTLKDLVFNGVYDALLYIPMTELNLPVNAKLYSNKQLPMTLTSHIKTMMKQEIEHQKLMASGIDPAIVKSATFTNINILTIRMDKFNKDKEKTTYAEFEFILGIILAILIYSVIFLFGAQVMRGVIEEKTSRIIEVIVSSVKSFELMMGKIIGIALVGLTQFLLWVVLTFGLYTAFTTFTVMPDILSSKGTVITEQIKEATETNDNQDIIVAIVNIVNTINFRAIIWSFLFYFLFGYLLYAAMFAAIGGAVDNETDTQQFSLPVSIPLILVIVYSTAIANNPDGSLAMWLSMIPFTSPVAMMLRIPFGVPYWQIALSLSILIVSFILITWMAAKIYRTGILMYGKKITYKELWKWLKY